MITPSSNGLADIADDVESEARKSMKFMILLLGLIRKDWGLQEGPAIVALMVMNRRPQSLGVQASGCEALRMLLELPAFQFTLPLQETRAALQQALDTFPDQTEVETMAHQAMGMLDAICAPGGSL